MKKKLRLMALAMLCPFLWVNAQQIKPLKRGDTIPEVLWNLPLNVVSLSSGGETITLNNYRNKLIILDFWATWCSSCIAAMPDMHNVQKSYDSKVVIVSLTKESSKKVLPFLAKNLIAKEVGLRPIAEYPPLIDSLFPHNVLPHLVWISPDQRFYAATSTDDFTAGNVDKALRGSENRLTMKKDIDPEKPLFLSEDYPAGNPLLHYSILFEGYYPGLASTVKQRRVQDKIVGKTLANVSLLELYESAIDPVFKEAGMSYSRKRVLLEKLDSQRLSLKFKPDSNGNRAGFYTYNIIVPPAKSEQLNAFMLEDLNRYTGYKGRIENRKVKYMALVKTRKRGKLGSSGGKAKNSLYSGVPAVLVNRPLKYLVFRLNDMASIRLPVVDETGFAGNVDVTLPTNQDRSPEDLNKDLEPCGLRLVEKYGNLKMFVLSGTKNSGERAGTIK